jgi:hypothetical protein
MINNLQRKSLSLIKLEGTHMFRSTEKGYVLVQLATGLLTLVFATGAAGERSVSPTTKDRFFQEAPRAWETFLQLSERLQGKNSFDIISPMGTAHNEYEVKRNRHCQSIYFSKKRVVKGKLDYHTFAWMIINPRYGFLLTRLQPSTSWVVADIYGDHQQAEKESGYAIREATYGFKAPLRIGIGGELLPEMLSRPVFQVQHCTQTMYKNQPVVEVRFLYLHEVKTNRDNLVQRGVIWLDPERLWCLAGYDIELQAVTKETQRETCEVEAWQQIGDQFWFPRRMSKRRYWREDNQEQVSKYIEEWDVFLPAELSGDEAFTLSAFGFPEPPLGGGGRPWYVWLAWGGILFLLLGLVCRWLLRRRAAGAG